MRSLMEGRSVELIDSSRSENNGTGPQGRNFKSKRLGNSDAVSVISERHKYNSEEKIRDGNSTLGIN